jgi:Secretion system C-terminal sorting domain
LHAGSETVTQNIANCNKMSYKTNTQPFNYPMNFNISIKIVALTLLITSIFGGGNVYSQFSQGPNTATVYSNALISGSASVWADPGSAASSDDNYAYLASGLGNSGAYSSYLFANNYLFNIPAGSIIQGIQVEVERSVMVGDAVDERVRLLRNGVVMPTDYSNNSNWPSADGSVIYGGPTDLWGATWTAADVSNSHFGFAIAIRNDNSNGMPVIARVDRIEITIFFTSNVLGTHTASFFATQEGNGVNLTWNSTEETGNESWEVQRTQNGSEIISVNTLTSLGEGSHAYQTIDASPASGMNYYRVRMVSGNGEESFTEWAGVDFATEAITFNAYPNPVTEGTFSVSLPFSEGATLIMLDASGSMVREFSVPADAMQLSGLSTEGLSSGMYFIRLAMGEKQETLKLMVK